MTYDSIVNHGDYFSSHYLAEVLPKDLKKKDGILAGWAEREKAGEPTPRTGLRGLKKDYFKDRAFFADFLDTVREGGSIRQDPQEWRKQLHELHGDVLRALGFAAEPRELTVERSDKRYQVAVAHAEPTVIAIECGWAPDVDSALDPEQAGLLLDPVELDNREQITTGAKLATWLFAADDPRPRYVLILAGGVIILADRMTWGEGRYLAVSLDVALGRSTAIPAELDTIAALFSADSLRPPEAGGAEPLSELVAGSRQHAVGVSKDLRDGLRDSVEIIANEVLDRIREQGARPEDIMEPSAFAKELGREALRYLYRIVFLLYAEARPELRVLPSDDEAYVKGYSLARLGDLIVRDLVSEESRRSVHLYESLDLLFRMVNEGHRPRGGTSPDGESEGEGLRFEPLKADLFEPSRTKLIGKDAIVLDEDDPDSPRLDTRLRNEALHRVLKLLMLSKGKRKERGGFISYAQLGINQLGAVYEGLMSYTGFIAKEELYEVAKNGDPSGGSWMIPASKLDDYDDSVFVRRTDENGFKTDERVRYKPGAFVYRLAGRDRQTSASYYTPESLTQVTVQLALRERLDQDGTTTTAREILDWKICEPALGSGAFLNEAINQIAAEYLKRRQAELGVQLEPEQYADELQKVKAYIALHNSYGVDLNETAVELAEVSLWLNVMYPGLQAPWFGLHLRRGNSLIGAGRRLYAPDQLRKKAWLTSAPDDHPFRDRPIPEGHIHHFLLPAQGWGAVAGEKEAKDLAPEQTEKLATWRKTILKDPSGKKKQGQKSTQVERLQGLARRAEYLWSLVIKRLELSEREISRHIDVWGAEGLPHPKETITRDEVLGNLTLPGTPYWRLKALMDAWCALWFWPLDQVDLLDGTADVYERLTTSVIEPMQEPEPPREVPDPEPTGFPRAWEAPSLFGGSPAQEQLAPPPAKSPRKSKPVARRPVIPLVDLDDWLDFAEALLGRGEVSEESLFPKFDLLSQMDELEDELPAWMGMEKPLKLGERFPWLDAVEDITDQQGFFHWELQFAQIFRRGGFDIQMGNPPWVRPRWEEASVLAELDPWFKLANKPGVKSWLRRKETALACDLYKGAGVDKKDIRMKSYFLRELAANSGSVQFICGIATYPLLVGTQPDYYRAFMCRVWKNLDRHGAAGLIHPDTHFGGAKEGNIRAAAYRHLRIHAHFMNSRFLFADSEDRLEFGIHIYGHVNDVNFVHASWLFEPTTLMNSLAHDGTGPAPGIKRDRVWDLRPHKKRLLRVDRNMLTQWRLAVGSVNVPVEQTILLYPVTASEAGAIAALAAYKRRLGAAQPRVSRGYDEANAKKDGLIRWRTAAPESLEEAILQGPHFAQATPFAKQPNIPCRNKNDWSARNLTDLPSRVVPVTNYERACSADVYRAAQDVWDGRPYTAYYRLAWRVMIPSSNERSLFAALFPPGPAHVDAVHTLALENNRNTALSAGFWAALPLDYILRITGRSHLRNAEVNVLPAPDPTHPLAAALLLRTLRLNCLTDAYTSLWEELYAHQWRQDRWAVLWEDLPALEAVGPHWDRSIPLRTERERRAALVELDALVALWLGMTVDQLIVVYRSRYPVLSDYEAHIWFDAMGRKIAGNHNTYGLGQTKEHFAKLKAHLDSPDKVMPPEGYTPPFYKADREKEYRQAHAVFSERLERAKAEGWRPGGEGT